MQLVDISDDSAVDSLVKMILLALHITNQPPACCIDLKTLRIHAHAAASVSRSAASGSLGPSLNLFFIPQKPCFLQGRTILRLSTRCPWIFSSYVHFLPHAHLFSISKYLFPNLLTHLSPVSPLLQSIHAIQVACPYTLL